MKRAKIISLITMLLVSLNSSADLFARAGTVGSIIIPASGLLTIWLHHDKEGLHQFALAYGSTLATVFILKPVIHRKRPTGGTWSFPSGHTASAFAGAAFLQRRYGWNYGAPAYVASWSVGLSRIFSDHHWPTDVLAGAMIGIASNLIFTKPDGHVHIQPFFLRQGTGIKLSLVG